MKLKIKENMTTEFITGLGMFIGGIVLVTRNIYVSSSLFSHGVKIGGIYLRSGALVLPFIAAAICMFLNPEKLWPKIASGAAFLLIIGVAIFSVNIRVRPVSIVKWIIILLLIFGGLVLILRAVYLGRKKK